MAGGRKDKEQLLSLVTDNLSAHVYVSDLQTNRLIYVSESARRELGAEEGQLCWEGIYGQSQRCRHCNMQYLLDNPGETVRSERYNLKVNRWYECHAQLVPWLDDQLVRYEVAMDITHRMRPDAVSAESEAYTRLILESIGDAVIVTDDQGKVTFMNVEAQRLTGWDGLSGLGRSLTEVFHIINTQTREVCENPVEKVLANGRTVELANHTSLISRHGVEYHIADSAAPVVDDSGRIHGVILVFRDVSEQYKQQEALRRSEVRFRNLFEQSINAIALHEIILDDNGEPIDYRFLEVNSAFEEMTGHRAKDLVGRTLLEVMPKTEEFWIKTYGRVALTGEPCAVEEFSQEIGKFFIVRAYSPRRGQFVTVFEDTTERKLMEQKLRDLAYKDSLTGLHNRRYLMSQLPVMDVEANLPLSVVIADMNGLKLINDAMGHYQGDMVLKQAASALMSVARAGDIVVRMGGDEFVMLLPRTTADEAEQLCHEAVRRCLAQSKGVVVPSLAVGSATKVSATEDMDDIFRRAEGNMYKHKMSNSTSRRSALIASLQQALAEKSHETEEHARNLQRWTIRLAQRIGLTNSEVVTCSLAALLHDVGKIAISESILDKPGPLTAKEWELMRTHSEVGYRIVASSPDLVEVAEGVLHHHERWDGGGYPGGLTGSRIPIASRIVALADAFDAMTNDRAYRQKLTFDEARNEIAAGAGSQFDPKLAQEFIKMLDEEKGREL